MKMEIFNHALEELLDDYLSEYTLDDLLEELDVEIHDVVWLLVSSGAVSEEKLIEVFNLYEVEVEDD